MGYSAAAIAESAFDNFAQGCGKEVVRPVGILLCWSWLRSDVTCWIVCVVVGSIRCLKWFPLTSGLAVSCGSYHVAVVCVSYTWWSCPMRVLGLTVWLDRLGWPIGWTCHCHCQDQLVVWSPMLLLQVHTMITYTDTYISHKCATWNAIQKVECPSHCKPESTIHKSEKLQFTFLCKIKWNFVTPYFNWMQFQIWFWIGKCLTGKNLWSEKTGKQCSSCIYACAEIDLPAARVGSSINSWYHWWNFHHHLSTWDTTSLVSRTLVQVH